MKLIKSLINIAYTEIAKLIEYERLGTKTSGFSTAVPTQRDMNQIKLNTMGQVIF